MKPMPEHRSKDVVISQRTISIGGNLGVKHLYKLGVFKGPFCLDIRLSAFNCLNVASSDHPAPALANRAYIISSFLCRTPLRAFVTARAE